MPAVPSGGPASGAPDAAAALASERTPEPLRQGPVLLASRGTRRDDAAPRIANLIARRLRLPLEVVTVLEPLPTYAGGGDGGVLPPTYDEARRTAREMAVRREVESLLPAPGDWTLHVRLGSIARAIADVGRERSASLIVVGAAPHRRLRHTIAGERAGQVLRAADCPVLSVAPGSAGLPTRVVVAVDFATPSIRAARAALLLLEECGTLTLLHVFPPADLDRAALGERELHLEASATDAFARLRAELESIAPAGVTIEQRTAVGESVERILSVAEEVGASLIALGTHGPNIIERIFVGSTASGVLHGAECSVLACPRPPTSPARHPSLLTTHGTVSHDPDEWPTLLDGLSARSANRRVRLEVDDAAFGAQVQGEGLRFVGAAYDARDRRLEIMLGDGAGGAGRLTRSLGGVDAVSVSADGSGRDTALGIRHGRAHTRVIFAD